MTYVKLIIDDLREKRLWPVALALVAGLVAVPLLLAKSASTNPLAVLPSASTPPTASATAIPVVSEQVVPAHAELGGTGRDPFTQQPLPAVPGAAALASAASKASGSSGSSSSSTKSTSTTGSSTTGTTTMSTSTTPTTTTTTPTTTPAPAGLGPAQSYAVTFAITNSAGGIDTTDSLERLSVLPSQRQPLIVELGVLQGGQRVLFALLPGAVVSGPGTCIPGPLDCEILSLRRGQVEGLSTQSTIGVFSIADFAVTAITTQNHGSAAAANQARTTASAAGRRVLNAANLSALSLFQYQPSLGAIVDLRNLKVGS